MNDPAHGPRESLPKSRLWECDVSGADSRLPSWSPPGPGAKPCPAARSRLARKPGTVSAVTCVTLFGLGGAAVASFSLALVGGQTPDAGWRRAIEQAVLAAC